MSLLVALVGVALLSVPALATRLAIGPSARVRVACLAAAAGVAVLGVGLGLAASPLILWWHDGRAARGLGLRHLSPGGPLAWLIAGILAGLGSWWVLGTLRYAAIARRRTSLPRWAADSFAYDEYARAEVRIASTSRLVAFAVPGREQHVVISEALAASLSDQELQAVLAHEGAHLRLRHARHLLVLATYERVWGWLPGVTSAVAHHRRAVEEWADIEAVDSAAVDRRALQRARQTLQNDIEIPRSDPTRCGLSPSPALDFVGLALVVAALIAAAGYSATHTVGDLSTALAALH